MNSLLVQVCSRSLHFICRRLSPKRDSPSQIHLIRLIVDGEVITEVEEGSYRSGYSGMWSYINQQIATKMITSLGYGLELAQNGAEALGLVAAWRGLKPGPELDRRQRGATAGPAADAHALVRSNEAHAIGADDEALVLADALLEKFGGGRGVFDDGAVGGEVAAQDGGAARFF